MQAIESAVSQDAELRERCPVTPGFAAFVEAELRNIVENDFPAVQARIDLAQALADRGARNDSKDDTDVDLRGDGFARVHVTGPICVVTRSEEARQLAIVEAALSQGQAGRGLSVRLDVRNGDDLGHSVSIHEAKFHAPDKCESFVPIPVPLPAHLRLGPIPEVPTSPCRGRQLGVPLPSPGARAKRPRAE